MRPASAGPRERSEQHEAVVIRPQEAQMTMLELLADQLQYIAQKINETDSMQSNDDTECGAIEGKLTAYRDMARKIVEQAGSAI